MKKIYSLAAAAAVAAAFAMVPARAESPPTVREDTTKSDFDAVKPYLGRWRSEEKTTRDGERSFRFEYELAYFDDAKTIIKMTILQVFAAGEQRLLWTGFKGWDPVAQETYYYGFSPLGRVSTGKFAAMGDKFVTFYSAFDSRGQAVELRDVFDPVKDGEYGNVSYLRPAGAEDWRVIARDTWRRSD